MSQKQNAGGPEKRAQTLRHRAELAWHLGAEDLRLQATPDRAQRLVHELQVHQIELEMQNEELQRARQEAEAARNQYFSLYDLAPVGYLTLDEHGLIQQANLTLAALLGVARASLAGASLEHFILAEDQDIFYLQRKRMDETGTRQVCELRLLRHGAPPFWANIETVLKAEPASGQRAYWTTVSDVSERKQANAAHEQEIRRLNTALDIQVRERTAQLEAAIADLKRATRIKNEFMATVSHELRSPLAAVLGLAELLAMQSGGQLNQRQVDYVQGIAHSGQRLRTMVDNMLRYADLVTSNVQVESEHYQLDYLCSSAVRAVGDLAAQKRQTMAFTIEPVGLVIVSDGEGIKHTLQQLLDNAIKFTPEGGSIGLDVRSDDDEKTVRLVVWDTGIGITAAQRPSIFQPFVQGDSSLTRPFPGAGLGLAYVQRMVELLGGTIAVESTPGAGSRFTVTLPLPR